MLPWKKFNIGRLYLSDFPIKNEDANKLIPNKPITSSNNRLGGACLYRDGSIYSTAINSNGLCVIILHELFHKIGLDHCKDTECLMYYGMVKNHKLCDNCFDKVKKIIDGKIIVKHPKEKLIVKLTNGRASHIEKILIKTEAERIKKRMELIDLLGNPWPEELKR